jgi:hypothetical protein
MRFVVAYFIVLGLVSTCTSATIRLTGSSGEFRQTGPGTMELYLMHEPYGDVFRYIDRSIVVYFMTPSPTPITWTVGETSSSDFGLEWSFALEWANRLNRKTDPVGLPRLYWGHGWANSGRTGVDPLASLNLSNGRYLYDFKLDDFEVTQNYWDNSPDVRKASMSWAIVGTGEISPEPLSLVLLIPGLATLILATSRYRRKTSCLP